jgi:KipI family sensor histidine kinase inhibitor
MTSGPVRLHCREYGDAGLLVDVLADDYERRWASTQSIGEALRGAPPAGVLDVVASFENVFVGFDPLLTDHAAIRVAVEALLDHPAERAVARRFVVPVVYGGEAGPDLESVATTMDLTAGEVVARHVSEDWVVRFVGSPVGAPMLDGPRMPRSVPRLAEPRVRVPPGSVAVSGFQSMIYNAPSPGGWRLIGRSPAVLFDLDRRTSPTDRATGSASGRSSRTSGRAGSARCGPTRDHRDPCRRTRGARGGPGPRPAGLRVDRDRGQRRL